jgi:ABC-type Fe3+ transport system substrate-binding protein
MASTSIGRRWRSLATGAALLCLAVACGSPAGQTAPASKPAPAPPQAPAAQSAPAAAQAAPAPSQGKQLLDDLVKKANEEGEVVVTLLSSWSQEMYTPLADAFKKRFGLTINVQIANMAAAQHYPVAIAETRAGTPPTYDAVQGDITETTQLLGAGGFLPVESWQALLAEVNPLVKSGKVKPEQISHGPAAGRGFQINGNVKQIIYNPRLIGEAELPRTHLELADPRYKDKFAQPPWTSHWAIAPAALENVNRDQWIDTVRAAGKNGGAVLGETPAAQRVALGQYAFALGQDTNLRAILAKDPQAPVAARFMDDYNEYNANYYAVRTGTRHPAAATLFVLWMTTPEAEAIWQPTEFQAVLYGESAIDQEHARLVREAGSKVVGWLENPRTVELLDWYQSADGRQYLDAMTKAIRGE